MLRDGGGWLDPSLGDRVLVLRGCWRVQLEGPPRICRVWSTHLQGTVPSLRAALTTSVLLKNRR